MLVYGSFSKQILIKNGYPVENLIEFGNPTYAFLDCLEKIDKEKFYSKHKIPTDRKIILFTSTKWQKNLMGKDFDPMIWKELLKHFSKNNEFFIILKPHPGENTTVYEKILSDYNYENATIIQDSLINLLYISDVVVSNYSSVIIDAVCLNKPVVELIWDTVSNNPSLNFHKIGITIPTKLENLKFTINSVMEEQSIISQISQKRINFLNEHYGIPIDKSIMINKLKNLI
jgi:UDP-N-acetylglucosamine 2-epimerase